MQRVINGGRNECLSVCADAFITLPGAYTYAFTHTHTHARTRTHACRRAVCVHTVRAASHKSNIMRSTNCVTNSAGVSSRRYSFSTQARRPRARERTLGLINLPRDASDAQSRHRVRRVTLRKNAPGNSTSLFINFVIRYAAGEATK